MMAASSITFRLFLLLNAVLHGTKALIYSNYPREATASTCLAIVIGHIASGLPWLLPSTAPPVQLSLQCRHCQCSVTVSSDTDVGPGSLKQPTIKYLTLGLSKTMNVSACLRVNPLVMPRPLIG